MSTVCYFVYFISLILSQIVFLRVFKKLLTLLFVFQNCIAVHESNGIDIIIALILNDINPLGKKRMDLVLELKVCFIRFYFKHDIKLPALSYYLNPILLQNNASKLLLAIMESRGDSENAERILYNMSPKQLVKIYIFTLNIKKKKKMFMQIFVL